MCSTRATLGRIRPLTTSRPASCRSSSSTTSSASPITFRARSTPSQFARLLGPNRAFRRRWGREAKIVAMKLNLLAVGALAAALAMPLGASAQQNQYPQQYPQQGQGRAVEPSHDRMQHRWQRRLSRLNLSNDQQQRIQSMIDQYSQAHPEGSAIDSNARRELRRQIMGVLSSDQQNQFRQEMRSHRAAMQQREGQMQQGQQQYQGPPQQYQGPPQQYQGPPQQYQGPPQQYQGPPPGEQPPGGQEPPAAPPQ